MRYHKIEKSHLTMAELKEFYELHKRGVGINGLAYRFKISVSYTNECLLAAEHLYGGGLDRLRDEIRASNNKKVVSIQINQEQPEFRPETQKNKRPAAEYTNTTPFGVAEKYQTING